MCLETMINILKEGFSMCLFKKLQSRGLQEVSSEVPVHPYFPNGLSFEMDDLGVRLIEISKMFAFIENIWLGACLV